MPDADRLAAMDARAGLLREMVMVARRIRGTLVKVTDSDWRTILATVEAAAAGVTLSPAPTDMLREAAHLVIDDTPLHLVCGVCGNREEDDFHEMTDWGHDFIPAARPPGACDQPPEGWYCTRTKGHDGPCAALRAALDTTKEAEA